MESLGRLLALMNSLSGFCYWKSPTSLRWRCESCLFSLLSVTSILASFFEVASVRLAFSVLWRLWLRLDVVWVSWCTRLRVDLELRLAVRALGITVDWDLMCKPASIIYCCKIWFSLTRLCYSSPFWVFSKKFLWDFLLELTTTREVFDDWESSL